MEEYIRKNLDSIVAAKNISDVEVIIVNDGSTDSTLAIAKQYEAKYPEAIRIIDKKNGHYGSCINAALKVVTGKYFRILDADDWFDTDALDTFLERLRTCDTDLVVTFRVEVTIGKNGEPKKKYFPIHGVEYGKVYDAREFAIGTVSKAVEFNMHSMTYKTEVLKSIGLRLLEGVCYTDMQYCFMPIDTIKDLVVYDIYLYHYFVGREDSSTNNKSIKRNFIHISKVLSFLLDYMDEHPAETDIIRANQLRFVNEATSFFLNSLRMQTDVSHKEYKLISGIVDGWKKQGVTNRMFNKYYIKHWLRRNTCTALNTSLIIYRILHPLK